MALDPACRIRRRGNGEWVRLPDTQAREAKEKMLTRLPGAVFEVESDSYTEVFTFTKDLDIGGSATEAKPNAFCRAHVSTACSGHSHGLVENDQN